MKRILALGGGVQSSTLFLMSCRGDVAKLDGAVFAELGWERFGTYEQLQFLQTVGEAAGIPIRRLVTGDIRSDALGSEVRGKVGEGTRSLSMPLFTRANEGGSDGRIRRQCTKEYKIRPIDKYLRREVLGLEKWAHAPREVAVELWMGISADESRRARPSRERWKVHRFPLCEKGISRDECKAWLVRHGHDVPSRSSCLGCPFHSNADWLELQRDESEWSDVVAFDAAMRSRGGEYGEVFLHRTCVALDQADLGVRLPIDGSGGLREECQGMCGV